MADLLRLGIPAWDLAIRAAVTYAALFIGLRLFGKREVGQFTLFDLVLVLLVANAVQPAITGPDSSLLGGLIIMVVLFAVNRGISTLRLRSPLVRRLISGQPTVLAKDGAWIPTALRREGLDDGDCEMALREHGIDTVAAVKLVVLEPDGTISIVPAEATLLRGRRRLHQRRL